MTEIDLEKVLALICQSSARAMQRYLEVSGREALVGNMPEYFAKSLVFDKLGDDLARGGMTLELESSVTSLRKAHATMFAQQAAEATAQEPKPAAAGVGRIQVWTELPDAG